MKFYFCLLLVFSLVCSSKLLSQCGCPGNSTNIGLANINELYDKNEITGNNFFVNLIYKYTYANNYFYHDINIGDGPIKDLTSNFLNLRISYKTAKKYIFETSLGYLIDRKQVENLGGKTFNSSGLSDWTLFARYILLKNLNANVEFSLGTGIKIPLSKGSEWIPQNIQPSTGAYAILLNFFFKKYYPEINSGLIIGNRTDYNFRNYWDYKYGFSSITSFVFLNNISSFLNLGIELRNDYRDKDYDGDEIINESGMYALALNPVVRLLTGNFIFAAFYSFPVYQYYNGRQIANKYSVGINISFNTNIGG